MKRACYVFLLLFAFSQLASALPEPNLTGAWIADRINGQASPSPEHYPIVITQNRNDFVVDYDRRSPTMKQEYVTDGKERELVQIGNPSRTYYTAIWVENSLIIDKESENRMPSDGRTVAMHTREVWSISADGKTLTRVTTLRNASITIAYKKL